MSITLPQSGEEAIVGKEQGPSAISVGLRNANSRIQTGGLGVSLSQLVFHSSHEKKGLMSGLWWSLVVVGVVVDSLVVLLQALVDKRPVSLAPSDPYRPTVIGQSV